ncbi:EAL domain-containing protein [Calidifontibacillus oryziterrae]|uniref:EAL domain-containing protein n=1 Tax=Calidifontibacillus oryziterrae TaxID=1191699 RepID=UPI00030B84ED|nr:EAL domain-containing protein [Calidifontibacillus oryziterrae]
MGQQNNDLNLQQKTLQQLRDLEVALNASSIVSITDHTGKISFVNHNFCELFKYNKTDLIGNTHNVVNSGHHSKEFFQQLWQTLLSGKVWQGEIKNRSKDGTYYWLDTVIVPFLNSNKVPYQFISIRRDITLKKEAELMVTHFAYYDSLTYLPNRKLFEKKMMETIESLPDQKQIFSVYYLDIDRFKYLNDTLGHETGDQLLKQIGDRLSVTFLNQAFIARMTGDEFALLVTNTISVKDQLDKLHSAFSEPFIVEKYELRITASIGVSTYPNDGQDPVTLIKNAHIALNRAKEKGKGTYELFTSNMDVYSYKLFTLENDLYKAYERNEFILYYQPRIDIRSGNILAAEALIRWKHPDWGMVSPDEFIPIAEEIGLIIPITNWALKTVCKQNKQWQDAGLPKIPISVNISTQHFIQRDLIATIQTILEETGLEPRYLEIEITENILIENSEIVEEVLKSLREMGIKIALDDFGTGFCSLSYLKNFSTDIVKIDKSFMRNIPNHPADSAIVTSVIHLAKILQKKVVAEGVEKEEQLTFLYEKHCDEIQGYFYSRPVEADAFCGLLEKGECIINVAKNTTNSEYGNRRKYLRLQLDYPLSSDMSIKEFRGKEIDLGHSEILIEDIGPGGLRFASNIKLPVNPEIILRIETLILGDILNVLGHIVWAHELADGVYEYGLEFLLTESQRTWLINALELYAEKLKENSLLPNSRFVTDGVLDYLKKD